MDEEDEGVRGARALWRGVGFEDMETEAVGGGVDVAGGDAVR